ncbi:MAG: bifunctional 2-C-methyl-D-erythritol 4-phosphate cytidylyltransferase/2-C-methyl-D-erythritol 2,4-cyclodiphosphate synthase [Alphaproteobacteria bacterium]|nr:bifunctional 2-C-methyl-D-erythritol 4-phosphate cytidylyltransferase/2-C-methyl-D-erythritol 2,4-cyclodiphosphate synthase [Alphaproteobacteria bacterium]
MTGCTALIVAAGRGSRIGGDVPKQYQHLAGTPLLRYSAEAFARHAGIDEVRVVIHPGDRTLYEEALAGLDIGAPVAGGETRQDSVRLGLESLSEDAPDKVLIHDAARPFVDSVTIGRIVTALDSADGALAAVPVVDTLKRGVKGLVSATLDRACLWRAQTPQGFRYPAILAAHRAGQGKGLTDDAAVAEEAGLAVALVEGSEVNFKVTTEDDLLRAERHLAADSLIRVGMGFDVHAFGPGDHVWLCGVRIEHKQSLIGHSDADVGLHALTDALLGAIGAGDIGVHFPDDDPRWKGATSDRFLTHAGGLIAERGGTIVNLDLTVICETPKLRPHNAAMVARVSEILGLPRSRVSIKATTTERLGFTGRGEGIAAQAIVSVRLPE